MKQHGVKRIAALIMASSCLLLPGCGDANKPIEPERQTQLDVDFIFSQEVPQTVAVYQAECMRLQDSQLYKDLLGGPAAETSAEATGFSSYSEPDETGRRVYLQLYDRGNAIGDPFGSEETGTFTYMQMEQDAFLTEKYDAVSIWCGRAYERVEEGEFVSYTLCPEEDLSFATRQEVQDAIIEQFAQWDIPLAPATCYSYTLDVLEAAAEDRKENFGEELTFTKDDEIYGLSFRQLIDGIPVVDVSWKKIDGLPLDLLSQKQTSLEAQVNREGTIYMNGISFLTTGEKTDEVQIVNGEAALSALDAEYADQAGINDLRVTDGLLMYGIFYPDEEKENLLLKPIWLFTVQYDKTEEVMDGHGNKTGQTVLAHYTDYVAVDGETGEVCTCAFLNV